MLERFKTLIDFFIKALTAGTGTLVVVWLFALIGILNTNPTYAPNYVTGGQSAIPLSPVGYFTNVYLPIYIIALLFSLLAESRLSNRIEMHLKQTILGSLIISIELFTIFAVAGFPFALSLLGFIISFWTVVLSLWVFYLYDN